MTNKTFKKYIGNLLCTILIVSLFNAPVYGMVRPDNAFEYFSYANKLSEIGVFIGTQTGEDKNFELYREPTRIEGLIILIRLLGKEQEALTGEYPTSPFTDVEDWARKYVDYGYSTGLTEGINETEFGFNEYLQPKSFATFALRALGYDDKKGDFSWSDSLEFANEINLIEEELLNKLEDESFNRNHVAKISYNALVTNLKNATDIVTLGSFLVNEGEIEKDIALSIEIIKQDKPIEIIVEAVVDENGNTSLLGNPTVSQETLTNWAKSKGVNQEGIDLIPLYYDICSIKGLNPVIQYVQMCLETGYLYKVKSQAGIDASYHNPCGLKTSTGGDKYIASEFAKFDSWYEGIDAHTDHSALYAGVIGYPRADTKDPRHFSYIFGRVTTVEGLSGTWAESDYHIKLLKLYGEVLNLAN